MHWQKLIIPLVLVGQITAAPKEPVPATDAPAPKKIMRRAMRQYFYEEKRAAKIGIFGSSLLAGAGVYMTTQSELARGAGYALIGASAVGLVVAGSVYFRTNSQVRSLDEQLETAPADFKRDESQRMEKVNRQFGILRIAEYSLLAGGAATAGVGIAKQADLTTGVGIGLVVDAVLLLLFDYFAETRAHAYTQFISDFTVAMKSTELIQGLSFDYRF